MQHIQPNTAAESERRQVTILFCDIVDSTRIAAHTDPEDWEQILAQYRMICRQVIPDYFGFIKDYGSAGDETIAYFTYPHYMENSAQYAVDASLSLIEEIRNAIWPHLGAGGLSVRIGVHTGIVITRADTKDDSQGQLGKLAGFANNIAHRLQSEAESNHIIISEATYDLVRGQFELSPLKPRALKGIPEPMGTYTVVGREPSIKQFSRIHRGSLLPLVGREAQVGQLLSAWDKAQRGRQPAIAVLSGNPGIGKSRLIAELQSTVQAGPASSVIHLQCSEAHQTSALFPFLEALRRELGSVDEPERLMSELKDLLGSRAPDVERAVAPLAGLIASTARRRQERSAKSSEAERYAVAKALGQWLLPARIVETDEIEAADLVVIEDAQWMDSSSKEILREILRDTAAEPRYRLMIVLSYREEFADEIAREFFGSAENGTSADFPDYVQRVELTPLGESEIRELIFQVTAGHVLPKEIVSQILHHSNGVAWFAEELTKSFIYTGNRSGEHSSPESSAILIKRDGYYELNRFHPAPSVPPSLNDFLLSRLNEETRSLVQLGSIFGPRFTREMISVVWPGDPESLDRNLQVLVREEILQPSRGSLDEFIFRHTLIQRAAYETLLNTDRQRYQRKVADYIRSEDRKLEASELMPPDVLGWLFQGAEMFAEAVAHWLEAARRSLDRSANMEAIHQANEGLACISRALELGSPTAFLSEKLSLTRIKGMALVVTKGFSATQTGDTLREALRIHERLKDGEQDAGATPPAGQSGETDDLFVLSSIAEAQILSGLWVHYMGRWERGNARECTDRILKLEKEVVGNGPAIESPERPVLQLLSLRSLIAKRIALEAMSELGQMQFYALEMDEALRNFERISREYEEYFSNDAKALAAFPELAKWRVLSGEDPGVSALVFQAFIRFYQGKLDEGSRKMAEAEGLAARTGHPFSIGWTKSSMTVLQVLLEDFRKARIVAEDGLRFCQENEQIFWISVMQMVLGWARTMAGDAEAGIPLAESGFDTYRKTGQQLAAPFFSALLTKTHLKAGNFAEAESWANKSVEEATQEDHLIWQPAAFLARAGVYRATNRPIKAIMDYGSAERILGMQSVELASIAKFNRIYLEAKVTKRLGPLFDLAATIPNLIRVAVRRKRMSLPEPKPVSSADLTRT